MKLTIKQIIKDLYFQMKAVLDHYLFRNLKIVKEKIIVKIVLYKCVKIN